MAEMNEVAELVGIEARDYIGQDKKPRHYCGLHLCHVEGTVSGVEGCSVETVSCPSDVDEGCLELGTTYELIYRTVRAKNEYGREIKELRLCDLKVVDG